MKKIILLLSSFCLLTYGCSEDKEETTIIPELPDNEQNIDISKPNNWQPGMDYAAYPDMPSYDPSIDVNVIVIDADMHARDIYMVINNESWPWVMNDVDKKELRKCFFPKHDNIKLSITESYDDYNPEKLTCDIVNCSFSVHDMKSAQRNLLKLENKTDFPSFPLIITSAGNGSNSFSQFAWDLCKELGGLSWEDHILPHFGWDPEGPFDKEQQALYKPGDVGAAYIIQGEDDNKHKSDIIVVGRDDGYGNKPGPILKERWICTYYAFDVLDNKTDGTSFSTPYVAKIAAEIKRRAPHYTNDEIAQLIFTTADDLGEPGCDETYGHGRMNPAKIWEELSNRGY